MRTHLLTRLLASSLATYVAMVGAVSLWAGRASADVEYTVSLTCGSVPIKRVTLGLVLPASIDPLNVQLGASSVGGADCLDLEPSHCVGASGLFPSVDPALSRVVPLNTAGGLEIHYFTMVGSGPGQRLCDVAQTVAMFHVVAPGETPSELPGVTDAGLDAVAAAVPGFPNDAFVGVDDGVLTVDDYVWVIASENATVRLYAAPAPEDPTGDRWDLFLDAAIEIEDLTFGIVLPTGTAVGQAQVLGCPVNETQPAPNTPPALSCPTSSSLTPQALPSQSWTVGPSPSLPRNDVMYFRVMGQLPSQGGFDPAVNLPFTAVRLATIQVDTADGDPPPLVLEGAEAVSPSGAAFLESNAGTVDTEQVALTQAGGLLRDADGDGIVNDSDYCIYAYDPTNQDHGGVLATQPDGVGDVCQCGDAHLPGLPGRGIVDSTDVPLMLEVLTALNTDPHAVLRCSVAGTHECNILDVVILEVSTDTNPAIPHGPGIVNACPGAPVL